MGEGIHGVQDNPIGNRHSHESEQSKKTSLSLVIRRLTQDFASFDFQNPTSELFCGMDIASFAEQVGPHVFPILQQTVGRMTAQLQDAVATPDKEGITWFAAKLETQHMPFDLNIWENKRIVSKKDVKLKLVTASAFLSEGDVNVVTTTEPEVNQVLISLIDVDPSRAEMLLDQQKLIEAVLLEGIVTQPGIIDQLKASYDRYKNLWPTRLKINYYESSKGDARRAVHNKLGAQLIISRMLRQPEETPAITARWVYASPDRSGVVKTPAIVVPIFDGQQVDKFEKKLTQVYDRIALSCRTRNTRSYLADGRPHDRFSLDF